MSATPPPTPPPYRGRDTSGAVRPHRQRRALPATSPAGVLDDFEPARPRPHGKPLDTIRQIRGAELTPATS
ncbi:hypothetical protein ACEZCY_13885 [Streptacidiphilus sp. N1-12]|uniref:Uncharacterized protein n=2 Tax=Streptacidiphilus alkalitolerans TaxID=3342712 RepID=A0ABV6WE42_9ACTN